MTEADRLKVFAFALPAPEFVLFQPVLRKPAAIPLIEM